MGGYASLALISNSKHPPSPTHTPTRSFLLAPFETKRPSDLRRPHTDSLLHDFPSVKHVLLENGYVWALQGGNQGNHFQNSKEMFSDSFLSFLPFIFVALFPTLILLLFLRDAVSTELTLGPER